MGRKIYLEDIPLDEARGVLESALREVGLAGPLGVERVPVAQAAGRVTAEAVWARLSSPHYHASAMDGYAVRAQDTVGAMETSPLRLELVKGNEDPAAQKPSAQKPADVQNAAMAVNTGHPLPSWANAVIMIEHVQAVIDGEEQVGIEIRAAVPPWQHVRPMGEDMVATELVLPANHRLRPVDLGAIAGSGNDTVTVYRRPRVAIIPTGSELVALDAVRERSLQAGDIIEYNSIVLATQVEEWGGVAARWPIVPDDFAAIRQAVAAAAREHDLVLVNAGSSAGSEDHTARVVQELGTLLVHGVAVRPGHPVIMGLLQSGGPGGQAAEADAGAVESVSDTHTVPVIGVPGYPVSAALTGEIFVEPLLARWQGQRPNEPAALQATLTRKVLSHTGDDDYLRVSVGQVGERVMATPISRGAGVITSLVRADGIVRILRFSEGLDAGSDVTVRLYRTRGEIARTMVAIGSHDLTLDLMAQFLAAKGEGWRLTSANVGSLGGLVALRRGEAHLGGSHLLDPETGTYNDSYVRRYLADQNVVVVTLVGREQGWIVPPGNPLGLRTWSDAAREDVSIVNRQRGAGTRVLLDYALEQAGINPETVRGYGREEYTHLAVAAAVASGTADAGPGIRAAARALELDFVLLAFERYELVIPRVHYDDALLQPLLSLIHDSTFRDAVAALPGYDVSIMGQEREISRRG